MLWCAVRCSYFNKSELREVFTLGDTQTSATQKQLHAWHKPEHNRRRYPALDAHVQWLHTTPELEVAGISDHDLLFTHHKKVYHTHFLLVVC